MTGHEEMSGLVPLYALDALEGAEMEEFESHLETCDACVAELAIHHSVAAAFVVDQAPPLPVWDRMTAEISDGRPLTTVNRLGARRTRRQPLAWVASFAAVLAVILGTLAIFQAIRLDQVTGPGGVIAAAQSAAAEPGAIVANLESATGRVAQVVLTSDGEGFVLPEQLEPLSADRTYQLWVITPDQVAISAGVLGSEPGPVRFTWSGEVAGFALTREVAGGVPSTAGDVVSVVEL